MVHKRPWLNINSDLALAQGVHRNVLLSDPNLSEPVNVMSRTYDSTSTESMKNHLQIAQLATLLASPEAQDRLQARKQLEELKDSNLIHRLENDFQAAITDSQFRFELVSILAESGSEEVIKTLVLALEDPCERVRQTAARGLAKQGTPALRAILNSIAFKPHGEQFYRAAHQAIYLLQFQAPLRDRQAISDLLRIIVGPNPQSHAPSVAYDALGN